MLKQICIINPTTNFLFVALLIFLWSIYKMYKTNVTPKSFIICNYLYIMVTLIAITLLGKVFECFKVTDINNKLPLMITYFILAMSGIFLMISKDIVKNHIGLTILIIALGLVIGTLFKNTINISNAIILTVGITLIITLFIFTSSKQNISTMANWTNVLGYILLTMIIIELIIIIWRKDNSGIYTIMKYSIICLFIFFTMADTSKILEDSKNITCKTHTCINYPLSSSGLMLNYINMFIRFVKNK